MKTSKKRALGIGLLIAATHAGQISLVGTESQSPASAVKGVPAPLTGKIVGVEKPTRSLTVQVKDREIKIKVTPQVQITKKGKPATFDTLAAGQVIRITFVEMPDGSIEVATLAILPAKEAEPERVARRLVLPSTGPLSGNPNPANIGGPIVSPSR